MWRSEITKQSEFQKTIRGSDFWLGSLKWEIVALSMFIVDHLGKGSSWPLNWATQLREQKSTKSGIDFDKRQQNKHYMKFRIIFLHKLRISILAWFSQMRNYSAQNVHCRSSGERVITSSRVCNSVKRLRDKKIQKEESILKRGNKTSTTRNSESFFLH